LSESSEVAATQAADRVSEALLTILRISRVMERIDAGVSPQQYRMLKLIGAGGERSAQLAEKLAVARPTLTSTADSLVAAGLASRQAEPGDRRVVRLCLTEAGQAAVQRADAAYAAWFGDVLDYTGSREQILADLALLDQGMTERRRARRSAAEPEGGQSPGTTEPAGSQSPGTAEPQGGQSPVTASPARSSAGQL
jgi:DNA-binding MarR family transcriptional regulator